MKHVKDNAHAFILPTDLFGNGSDLDERMIALCRDLKQSGDTIVILHEDETAATCQKINDVLGGVETMVFPNASELRSNQFDLNLAEKTGIVAREHMLYADMDEDYVSTMRKKGFNTHIITGSDPYPALKQSVDHMLTL